VGKRKLLSISYVESVCLKMVSARDFDNCWNNLTIAKRETIITNINEILPRAVILVQARKSLRTFPRPIQRNIISEMVRLGEDCF